MSNIREVIGDDVVVSVSQIKAFLKCPRLFELHYVRGVDPEFVPRPLAFGSALHAVLARYYLDLRNTGTPPPVVELIDTFSQLWRQKQQGRVPIQGEDEEDDGKTDAVDLAARMIRAFHAQASLPADTTVEDVEVPFSATLVDPDTGEVQEEKLVGVMDLVVLEDGHAVVVEHKSAAKKYGADQIRHDIQPTAYQLAMQESGWQDVSLRFQVITKAKNPQVQIENLVRTAIDEDDFRRLAIGVLKGIDAGVNYPVRSWACKSCPYKHACTQLSRRKIAGGRSLKIIDSPQEWVAA